MHKCSFFRGYRRGQGAFPGDGIMIAKTGWSFTIPTSLPAAVSKVQRNPPIYWVKSGAQPCEVGVANLDRVAQQLADTPRDSFLSLVQIVQ